MPAAARSSSGDLDDVRAVLDDLTSIDVEAELVRRDDLGKASFETGIDTFNKTLNLFKELKASDLSVLPSDVLKEIHGRASQAAAHFEEVRDFELAGQQDPVQARDGLVERIEAEYSKHFRALEPHINYLLVKQTDFEALEGEARRTMAELDAFTRQKQHEQEDIRHEMEETLRSVRDAAAKAGVGQQSIVFGTEAESYGKQAKAWLIASAVFGVVALGYAVIAFVLLPFDAETMSDAIRVSLARLVILTILLFGLAFTGRQFVAAKHNQTVNLHRQNALRTFETFVNATDDGETKDAVLLEATRSIFSSQATGYLRGDGDRGDSPSTVVEVVRRVTSSGEAG